MFLLLHSVVLMSHLIQTSVYGEDWWDSTDLPLSEHWNPSKDGWMLGSTIGSNKMEYCFLLYTQKHKKIITKAVNEFKKI